MLPLHNVAFEHLTLSGSAAAKESHLSLLQRREKASTMTNKMDPSKLGLCLTPGIQWGLSVMIRDYETVFDGVAS